MNNPDEPAGSSTSEIPTRKNVHFYSDKFPAIAAMSLVIGAIVGASIFNVNWQSALPVFVIPGLGWIIAFGLLTLLIRNAELSILGRLVLALLLSIPAYILYVPVCIAVSISTTPVLGTKGYGPTSQGVIFGSAVAFFVILMAIAAVVRAVIRKRAGTQLNHVNEQG